MTTAIKKMRPAMELGCAQPISDIHFRAMTSGLIMICGALIPAKWTAQMALEWVNQHHVQAHANAVPAAFADTVTPGTYAKSTAYTLAKSRFEMIHLTWSAAILAATILTGVLPWIYRAFQNAAGSSVWAGAAF